MKKLIKALIALALLIAPILASASVADAHKVAGSRNWRYAARDVLGQSRVNRGDIVGFWQALLYAYGQFDGCPAVDGIFGPSTDAGTRNFQRFFGLQVDGLVGPQTWGMGSYVLERRSENAYVERYRPGNASRRTPLYQFYKRNIDGAHFDFIVGDWSWEFLGPPDRMHTVPWESPLPTNHPGIHFGIRCP